MSNRAKLLTAALLAVLMAAALAAATSVTIYADNKDAGNFTPVQFDEGKSPVYFVLWWPPDDAQWTTLVDYIGDRAPEGSIDTYFGVVLSGVGHVYINVDVRVHIYAGLDFLAKPLVGAGVACYYVYDPTVSRKTETTYMGEMLAGYLVWCRAGVIGLRAHGAVRNYTLWVPVAAYSDGEYYYMRVLYANVNNEDALRVDGDRFRVVLPEEGIVVAWNVVFPTYFSAEDYKRAADFRRGYDNRLRSRDWMYRFWTVSRGRTAEVWPGSYLVVGVWPNGTVKEWRFVARRPAWISKYPPGEVPRDLEKVAGPFQWTYGFIKSMSILTLYYDEGVPNFNDLVGDRGNGTVVLTFVTVPPNSWLNYSIVLLPNGTALYVTGREYSEFKDILWSNFGLFLREVVSNIHLKHPVNISRGFKIGYHPDFGNLTYHWHVPNVGDLRGLWPRGTDGGMYVVTDWGDEKTYVAVIYDAVVYRNGTLVIKRYAVPSWTGCVQWPAPHKGYIDCSLADFFYDEWKFDITPLRLPWACPTCVEWRPTFNYTYPASFATRLWWLHRLYPENFVDPNTLEIVKKTYVLMAKAPTTLLLARAYAGYRVANVTRLNPGIGQYYLVVKFLEPTRSYLALIDAVATVRRLLP